MKHKKLLAFLAAATVIAVAHLISSASYERPTDFERPDQLNRQDCRIGVLAGFDSEAVSRRTFPRAQIIGFHEFEDAFLSLLSGRIEAFVYNEHVLNVGLRAYPNRFRMLDESISRTPGVVLISPKRPDLVPLVNRFIARYRASGYYDEMYTRWCQSDVYVPMPEISDVGGTNVLRVGTSGMEEPSSFVDDSGALTGFDVEFARRFAQVARLSPKIQCRPDDEILEELRKGDLDLVIDDYNLNETPSGLLASDPYFDADMKVLVRGGDDSGMMLGSTRLGWSRRLIKDPRIAVFVRGFFTTLALTFLAAFLGFGMAFAIHFGDVRAPAIIRGLIANLLEVVRLLPPPIVILLFSNAILMSSDAWYIAVASFGFWFASFLEPSIGDGPKVWLEVVRDKLIGLMQWTSVVGSINVCDLTMATDLVCGRSLAAIGPIVSVAAAYCLMNWIVKRFILFLEGKLK